MNKRPTRASGLRRGIAVTVFTLGLTLGLTAGGLAVIGGLAVYGGIAGAAPQPTVAQVQARINQLTSQFDQVSVQLDQASQQLSAARSKLAQVRVHLDDANARFREAQASVAQTAAAAFEDSGATSVAGVLTSGDPSAVLQSGSLLMELSGRQNAQTKQLLADASDLAGAEQQMQRTENGVEALKARLTAQKNSLGGLLATEKATLASLTVPQQQTVTSNSIGAGGTTTATYTGPTSTQAERAVAFAFAQLGKPYQWGATGPGSFDCSGLAQAAWAAAGVSIPRDTYEQWGVLPHIAASALQPGDLLYYDGVGHVAMYVGDGYIIDAPQTGLDVEKIPLATAWYAETFVGAARP
jgi:peptidoglycan DL-endopeptidase CwlO